MSRETNLVKNTVILSMGTFFPKIVGVLILPILTGHLTKTEYGTYDLIVTMVSLLLPIVTFQIQSAAFRFLIDCRNDRNQVDSIVTNIFIFTVPISIVTLCILYFTMPGIGGLTKALICLYYLFDILYVTLQQVTRGFSLNLTYSISAIIVSLLSFLFTILLVKWGDFGINGIVITLIVSYFSGCIVLALRIRKYVSFCFVKASRRVIGELLGYSWPMVINNLSSWVLRLSNRIVISLVLGVEANAVYAVANKIPNLLLMLQNTFTLAWQENASIVSKDCDASTYYSNVFDKMFCIVSGVTALLISFLPILFRVLINGDYSEAYSEIPILFLGVMFFCLAAFQGGIYVAYKQTKKVGLSTMVAAFGNFIIDILLIKRMGITAGSISTLISNLLLLVYRMFDLRKIVDIDYDFSKITKVLIVLIFMCMISSKRLVLWDFLNLLVGISLLLILNWHVLKMIFHVFCQKIKMARRN